MLLFVNYISAAVQRGAQWITLYLVVANTAWASYRRIARSITDKIEYVIE